MPGVRIPPSQRFILDNVSWTRYTRLLRGLKIATCTSLSIGGFWKSRRFLMNTSSRRPSWAGCVVVLTEEFDLPLHPGGSTTMRRKQNQKGLEPDDCFWIAHEAEVRGKTIIDLRTDPPPDLAIEVDVSRSSLDRMGIYARLLCLKCGVMMRPGWHSIP